MLQSKLGARPHRDYGAVVSLVKPGAGREATMRAVIDALWDALGARGVSWIGFYTKTPGRDEMILGPCRDKPACSPLGMQGMCGQCWTARKPMVVQDVRALGENYIACDPKDASEVVIPLFEPDGSCWGVLDADSYEVGAFNQDDALGLRRVVERAGLSTPQNPPPAVVRF